MGIIVGTWLCGATGDNVHIMRQRIYTDANVKWGLGVGLGYVPTLEVKRKGSSAVIATISGSWSDADEWEALFAVGTASALFPAAGVEYVDYESIIVLDNGVGGLARIAADNMGGTFDFRMKAWS